MRRGGRRLTNARFPAERGNRAGFNQQLQDTNEDPAGLLEAVLGASACRETQHSGRTLREHLVGVFEILQTWQCPTPTCLAGLFHSVYGTHAFRTSSLRIDKRETLRAAIGEDAETLVFIFCTLDRAALFRSLTTASLDKLLSNTSVFSSYASDDRLFVSSNMLQALLELLLADRVEQLPHRPPVASNDPSRIHLSRHSDTIWARISPLLHPAPAAIAGSLSAAT